MPSQSRNEVTKLAACTRPLLTACERTEYPTWLAITGNGDTLAICANFVVVPNQKQAYT